MPVHGRVDTHVVHLCRGTVAAPRRAWALRTLVSVELATSHVIPPVRITQGQKGGGGLQGLGAWGSGLAFCGDRASLVQDGKSSGGGQWRRLHNNMLKGKLRHLSVVSLRSVSGTCPAGVRDGLQDAEPGGHLSGRRAHGRLVREALSSVWASSHLPTSLLGDCVSTRERTYCPQTTHLNTVETASLLFCMFYHN